PFGAPRRLGAGAIFADHLALAVGGDGQALLALPAGVGLLVFERKPGGAFVRRKIPGVVGAVDAAAAIGPDGAAVLAWQIGDGVSLMRRAAGAAFGRPEELTGLGEPQVNGGGEAILTITQGDGPPGDGQPPLRVLLGADGRAVLTWAAQNRVAHVATAGPTGAPQLERLGSPLRDPVGLTPLLLAGGTPAVAWSDEAFSRAQLAPRVHLAVEGVPAATREAVPALDVGAPRDASLRPAQSLVLPVRCSAACDVRARTGNGILDPQFTLSDAGTVQLRIDPFGEPVAPAKPGRVKIKLSWGAPGAHVAQERTISVRLRRLPAPPFPRLLDVRARRAKGGVVDVRWRTDVRARDATFSVIGTHSRSLGAHGPSTSASARGTGQRRFHVRLTGAARTRWVRVAVDQAVGNRLRTVLVRVS
ncbi:MAG TPA: hypothetical protein VI300_15825, partial [Solirubrobacter sp.]